MDDVKAIMLASGRLVVGTVVYESVRGPTVGVNSPHVLTQVQGPNGQPAMAMIPYAQWNPEATIPFERTAIESISDAGELEKPYLEATSGIALAGADMTNVTTFNRFGRKS